MTGLTILKQAYHLLGKPQCAAQAQGDENGLVAVNQICSELWHREHFSPFHPVVSLQQKVEMSYRFLPALTYGTAMLLSLNAGEDYSRYQQQYQRAARITGGRFPDVRQTAFPDEEAM